MTLVGFVFVANHQALAQTTASAWRVNCVGRDYWTRDWPTNKLVHIDGNKYAQKVFYRQHHLDAAMEPVVEGEVAYFAGTDGYCYAVNLESGKLLWRFDSGCPIRPSRELPPGPVVKSYIPTSTSGDGQPVRIPGAPVIPSGAQLSYPSGAPSSGRRLFQRVLVSATTCYFAGDYFFHALDKQTGKLRWRVGCLKWTAESNLFFPHTAQRVMSDNFNQIVVYPEHTIEDPIMSNGLVVVYGLIEHDGERTNKWTRNCLVAVDAITARLSWYRSFSAWGSHDRMWLSKDHVLVTGTPSAEDHVSVKRRVGANRLTGLDIATGLTVWETSLLHGPDWDTVVITDDLVFVRVNTPVTDSEPGGHRASNQRLACVDSKTGKMRWEYESDGVLGRFLTVGETIVVTQGSMLTGIDRRTGAVRWTVNPRRFVNPEFVTVGGDLLVLQMERLDVVDPDSGALKWGSDTPILWRVGETRDPLFARGAVQVIERMGHDVLLRTPRCWVAINPETRQVRCRSTGDGMPVRLKAGGIVAMKDAKGVSGVRSIVIDDSSAKEN